MINVCIMLIIDFLSSFQLIITCEKILILSFYKYRTGFIIDIYLIIRIEATKYSLFGAGSIGVRFLI